MTDWTGERRRRSEAVRQKQPGQSAGTPPLDPVSGSIRATGASNMPAVTALFPWKPAASSVLRRRAERSSILRAGPSLPPGPKHPPAKEVPTISGWGVASKRMKPPGERLTKRIDLSEPIVGGDSVADAGRRVGQSPLLLCNDYSATESPPTTRHSSREVRHFNPQHVDNQRLLRRSVPGRGLGRPGDRDVDAPQAAGFRHAFHAFQPVALLDEASLGLL
jgi:hypothetical protein